jgi:hypothetical protein
MNDETVGRVGSACYDCARPYGDGGFPDLVVPDDVWAAISPTGDSGGLLCPSCMCFRAAALGLTNVPARFTSGPFVVSGLAAAYVAGAKVARYWRGKITPDAIAILADAYAKQPTLTRIE